MDTELPQLGEEIRPRYRCGVSLAYHSHHPHILLIVIIVLIILIFIVITLSILVKVSHTLRTLLLFSRIANIEAFLKITVLCVCGGFVLHIHKLLLEYHLHSMSV